MGDYGPGRKNQYFVPGKGISREVITADICKYLDHDATVRPHNYQVRPRLHISPSYDARESS